MSSQNIVDVNLTELLQKQIASLYMSEYCSDIILHINGHKIPAHRSIIGARCEYINNFFSTALNDPNQTTYQLNVPLEAFKVLLEYFYTGQIILSKIKDIEILSQILNIIEEYCLFYLKEYFENYFNEILSVENSCQFLELARIYKLNELEIKCLNLIDTKADQILTSESFKNISKELLQEILERETFYASSELAIFNAVNEWSKWENRDIETVISLVNLTLIPLEELLKVRKSGTLSETKIFDTIEKQMTEKRLQRSSIQTMFYEPNENVVTSKYNVRTIKGDRISELLNGNSNSYDDTNVFIRHTVDETNNPAGIILELGRIFNINHIKMLLWDRDYRIYSYFIEISTDQKKWERIIDYSSYSCRSWQNLYFSAKPIKYIKIIGTHCSASNYFDIVTLEAYYRETIPEIRYGIIVPKDNVALFNLGAIVIEGEGCPDKSSLINGNPAYGYTWHEIGNDEGILIRLNQPYYIASMRLSLYGNFEYTFYIETSLNKVDWKEVVNKRNEFVRNWYFNFPLEPVLFIRIVGTGINTTNLVKFYINDFECSSQDSD